LAGSGVLVVNLAGDEQSYAGLIGVAMQVFDDQVIVFPVREDDNHVLLAFKNPVFEPNWRRLHAWARELRSKYELDFPDFLEKIERSAKLGLARREAARQH
jgi:spermidine synthase